MKLDLYIGKAGTGKTQACFARIQEIMKEDPKAPIIMLVPDSATYTTERALAESMPRKGFTTVRVVGFGRLAHQVFQSLGKERRTMLSSVGRTLLLRYVMAQQGDDLPLLGQAMKQPNFASVLQQLMKECQAFQVSVADLQAGATKVPQLVLQKKLTELARVFASYHELLKAQFGEDVDPLIELNQAIPLSPIVQGAYVFVDGFHWLTPLQEQVVHTLFRTAKYSVLTLTLPAGAKEREQQRRSGALFGRPYELYTHMKETYGGEIREVPFGELRRFQTGIVHDMVDGYFSSPMKGNALSEGLTCIAAYHREREVDAVCRKLLAWQQEGYRWKDMTVMMREEDTYGALLEQQLGRYEIPYFTDRRHPMVTHPLAELLTGLLQLVMTVFDHDTVFRLLKTDLFPVTRRDIDILENYCLEFGLYRQAWLREAWTAARVRQSTPDEEAVVSPEEEALREAVNATHTALMDILRPWWEFAQEAHTGKAWCEALFRMLETLDVPRALQRWCAEADEAGNQEDRAAHEQMYRQVLSLFDELMVVATEDPLSTQDMMRLLEEGLGDMTYSLVPPSLDHVTITTIERGYTRENKLVCVLGLNEGVFPQRLGDEGILKDTEREALRSAGIALAEGALVRAFNENFLLYLACTRAKEQLCVSYARSNEEGNALEPSLIIKRWQQLGYVKTVEDAPLTIPAGKETAYMWRPAQTISLFSSRAGELVKGHGLSPVWGSFYNWALESPWAGALRYATRGLLDENVVPPLDPSLVKSVLVSSGYISGSVSSFEQYYQCPFRYFARYGLRLEERPVRAFSAPEIGTFLHDSLYLMGKQLLARHAQWRDLNAEEQERICRDVVDGLVAELGTDSSVTEAFMLQFRRRLEHTLVHTVKRLHEWSSRSHFQMTELEQSFGMGKDGWPAIRIPIDDTYAVRLRGRIDRIDRCTALQDGDASEGQPSYALVIDYKSGGTSVAASEIYYGLKLQLVTYLLALEMSQDGRGEVEPAALVYSYVKNEEIPVKYGVTEAEAEAIAAHTGGGKNGGYFLRNTNTLTALDMKVAEGKGSPYVPVRLKKDGDVYSSDLYRTKSVSEFSVLQQYVRQLLQKTGKQMLAGQFPVAPFHDGAKQACSFCPYRAVCRFDGQRQSYRYVRTYKEEEVLERMEGGVVYEMDGSPTKRY